MEPLYQGLFAIMKWCYGLTGNYGTAIILFTVITKIILLPVSLWTYYESIKMIKIQPEINLIKAKYYGQKDVIAEEEAKLYKEKHYHPLISIIPLILQLVLLVGVVGAVRMGIEDPSIDMHMGPIDLGMIPCEHGLSLIWAPIAAALSAWLMCLAQNKSNVLQAEQSKFNKYGTMIFSVALSLYLGWFVPVGVALYWICSNLFAILQLYLMNAFIRPRRFVDYEKLEESRARLAELQSIGKSRKDENYAENKRREKEDYKRFFSVVNKHIVFYSESSGFYKYYREYIELLLKKTKLTIHYITSDPYDNIFQTAEEEPRIRAYYIGENKLITLMMKMDADMVVMTMPDIENYHIKRSYLRKDIEYLYVMHGIGSNSMLLRKGALDHYDTVFCAGEHQEREIRETEKVYGLPQKKLVPVGYPLIDSMRAEYNARPRPEHERKRILIAPSWQKDNIVDSCLEEILEELKDGDHDIIVRPHPQEVRLKKEYMETLKQNYSSENVEIQTDFS
ncbi:MAG: membrane protein insertase YidC, partial [Lachnospiraceae bacterium]|nr:membrane protein insertase YidC [Lachnospiraceae bacterium]